MDGKTAVGSERSTNYLFIHSWEKDYISYGIRWIDEYILEYIFIQTWNNLLWSLSKVKYDFMGVILQALRKFFTSLAQSAYKKDEQRERQTETESVLH